MSAPLSAAAGCVTLPADHPVQRDRLFRSLVDNSLDLVSLIGRDGKVLYASPSHEAILGYQPEDLAGCNALDLVHPDDQEAVIKAVRAGFAAGKPVRLSEFRFRHADGSWRVCEAAARDLRDDPVIAGVVVNAHDVTSRKQAEQARREDERVSEALATAGRELIRSLAKPALLDRPSRLAAKLLRCDSAATLLRGERSRDFLQMASHGTERPFARHLSPVGETMHELCSRIRVQDVVEVEIPCDDHDARCHGDRWLCMAVRRASRLQGVLVAGRLHDGEPFSAGDLRIAEGIARLASMAVENARLLEQLDRANRIKSDFVATISHELRTPLNIVVGYLALLAEGDFGELNDGQKNAVRCIERSSHALLGLISETLDLSRLEREGLPVDRRDVDPRELLAALERDTRRLVQKDGIRVEWLPEDGLPRLHTDPGKLKIALRTLLSNAVKFTDAGTVSVAARGCAGGVEFCVADSGAGIPREAFSRIFEPFTQLEDPATRRHGGTGLGLYVARRLVELLGGTLWLTSRVGSGSTFTVWIPSTVRMDHALRAPLGAARTVEE